MPRFLTIEDVLELHAGQLEKHGGSAGVRDRGRLEAAIGQPKQAWDDAYLYDLAGMAAAYWIGICHGHPFIDGNKRTATSDERRATSDERRAQCSAS